MFTTRVVRDDIIYHGVDRDPFYPDTYCEARPDPMHAARTQCVCAKDMENMLVETCEFDTSEFSSTATWFVAHK